MTNLPTVSVIVVSHGRPALLRRALIGIGQLFYRPYELVVIADAQGLETIRDLPFFDRIKTAVQDIPNISAARNLGADLAGGRILAFIDDDAVPEPTWLTHLVSPLLDTEIAASTGTVLGRNGISEQWANRIVDSLGMSHVATAPPSGDKLATKLEGTNMAIRRDCLAGIGGFDEGFGFYLDETDLSFRLLMAGRAVATVPLALVHHGYAASARRTEDRVPLGLRQIGASTMLYLRKHSDPDRVDEGQNALRAEQSLRLARLVDTGRLSQADATRLLAELETGFEDGRSARTDRQRSIAPAPGFQPLVTVEAQEPVVLAGRWFRRRRLIAQAIEVARTGRSVSLFLFEHTVRAHRVQFTEDGIWQQTGGLFGPSVRRQPRFTCWSFSGRIHAETHRLARIRWISGPPKGHIRTLP